MSPAHVIRLIEHSQVVYRIEHSAAVQAIIGTLLTTLVGLAVAAFFNRRRIAWRAYVDAPITLNADMAKTMGSRVIHKIYVADGGDGQQPRSGGPPTAPTPQFPPVATAEVQVPWLVLLRIRNSGRVPISGKEFNTPLTFTFPGREVRDVTVIDGAGDDPDKILVRPKSMDIPPPTPTAPTGPYRRVADWLRGRSPAAAPVPSAAPRATDYIQLSDKFALNRRDRITIMAVLSGTPAAGAKITANGKLIGGNIDARITVAADTSGSVNGLNTLLAAGPTSAGSLIAMSDGPAPAGGYAALDGTPVAIITFEVVVNHQVGLYNLSTAQIKGIYDGVYTNWRQLGGPNLPVRIISREYGSGSRRAFDANVLGEAREPTPTSFDCRTKSDQSAPVTLCDVQSTGDLLNDVETIPGAIGYAQTGDIATTQAGMLQPVALDGLSGYFGNIGRLTNNYHFWTTEYIYTYGRPTGLAAAFLGYLSTPVALKDLDALAYTPCREASASRVAFLCEQAGS